MTLALQLAERVLEGENPKHFFQRIMPHQAPRLMQVGEEVCHGTGDTRDIMSACIDKLQELDAGLAKQELEDSDVANYVKDGVEAPDFDPEWYCFEHLYGVMQKLCPPFSYFGHHEADCSVGCWPPDTMTIEELADMDKLTYFDEDHGTEAQAVSNGDFTQVPTRYVLIEIDGDQELWDKTTRKLVWRY